MSAPDGYTTPNLDNDGEWDMELLEVGTRAMITLYPNDLYMYDGEIVVITAKVQLLNGLLTINGNTVMMMVPLGTAKWILL